MLMISLALVRCCVGRGIIFNQCCRALVILSAGPRAIQMTVKKFLVSLLLCISTPAAVSAAKNPGFDLVTMNNGDIHNGTVAQEYFSFDTAFGMVSIPYGQMAALGIGNPRQADRLLTRQGDTFRGRVMDQQFTMLRVLEATLVLSVSDIADIAFAEYPIRQRDRPAADIVESRDGDRFFARVIADEITINDASATHILKHQDIDSIDFAMLMDGDEQLTQVSLKQGRIYQGDITSTTFQVETLYGQTLEIPVASLSTLVFNSSQKNATPDLLKQRSLSASTLKDRLRDGSFAPEVVVLAGGNFIRGDAQGDDDEKPPVEITLGPFAIGITEVTFEQYDRFCDDTRRDRPDEADWGRGRRPVINVSWKDAVAYTEWLSRKTRHTYRLPTDAEWEYAARAGTLSRFWWGDEVDVARANCEGCGSLWDGDRTARVGRFPPNPFGLYDTAGNVFEWVADCYHSSFADAPADGTAVDKPGCGKRVIRGGAWSFPPGEVRSANRWRDFPARHSDDTGFRVVREL